MSSGEVEEKVFEILSLSGEVLCTVESYPEPILLKKAVSSATNIPEDFFELLWADNAEEATMILIADCPWDMIVSSLIDRDFDEELRLTARIVQLCLGDATAATDKIFIHAIQIHDDKMVKIFLKNGFPPNHRCLPLHVCAKVGDIGIMHALLEARADVNAANSDGDTPLHFAACRSDPQFAELLLEKGADASTRNLLGEPALCVDEPEPEWAGSGDCTFSGDETEESDVESVCSSGPDPVHNE